MSDVASVSANVIFSSFQLFFVASIGIRQKAISPWYYVAAQVTTWNSYPNRERRRRGSLRVRFANFSISLRRASSIRVVVRFPFRLTVVLT